jgi:hypothetical protein
MFTLTATDTADSIFTGWSGACSGTGSCQVAIDADTNVQANFAPAFILHAEIAAEALQGGCPPSNPFCTILWDARDAFGTLAIGADADLYVCNLPPQEVLITTQFNVATCQWKILDGTSIDAAAQGSPDNLDWGGDCDGVTNECFLGPRSTTTTVVATFRL